MSGFSAPFDQAIKAVTAPGSPFEITSHQSGGVDYRIYANAPKNLIELLAPGRQFSEQEFVIYQDDRWSFSHFHRQADLLGVQLIRQFNIGKGDRVAIAMRNCPEWMAAFLAIISVGAVAVPLNSWGARKELQQSLADAHCAFVFCDQQRLDIIQPQDLGLTAIVVHHQGTLPLNCHSYRDVVSDVSVVDLCEIELRSALSAIVIDRNDEAMIMFTSGTSGSPKAALFTHFQCCQSMTNFEAVAAAAYMTNIDAYTKHLNSGRPSKALITVPLFHVSGLFAQFLLTLRGGRSLVLMYKWDPAVACELITQEQITIFVAAPSMLLELARHPKFSSVDTSTISNVSGAGAATPAKLAQLLKEKFSDSLPGSGWGMTETGAAGASLTGCFYDLKRGSSGFLNPIVDLCFCDENGIELQPGTPGEIWIKSPTTIAGYTNNPEANENEFKGGWFKTGDIGYLDSDKCLFICDRAKDMVIRGGENIFPIEIENIIQSLPSVLEACGFSIPSEQYGEELMVVVRVAPEDLAQIDEKLVQEHVRGQLANFKVPSIVTITDQAFPLNASNKVVKKQVKRLYGPQ
jgi:acyl-CoA synthetase (AMP-forming)/AMP-acid ligase II|tara:strand:+ start:239 stop:1963 length:1725 start_codon:yes stop_codon:yes gene_type:complete